MFLPRVSRIDGERRLVLRREALHREAPEESIPQTVFQNVVSSFWAETFGTAFSPSLIRFVWVASRCIQLVAQNIKQMPLMFQPGSATTREPAWLSSPDPVWYPNGLRDCIFSAVDSYYRWGDAFLLITDTYADGFPSAWTVMDAPEVGVDVKNGRRRYQFNDRFYSQDEVVQVSRDPRGQLKGTSALRSYADVMVGLGKITAAATESITQTPLTLLSSKRPIDQPQAQEIQSQWTAAGRARTPGAPAIIPPELAFEGAKLQFSPEEMMLVDVQEFDARVLASSCGVPPFLLNIALTGGLTYQNPAMLGEYWWRTELSATCDAFESAFTARMLPAGSSVWFDPKHLTGPLTAQGEADSSPVVKASPADQPGNVVPLKEGVFA